MKRLLALLLALLLLTGCSTDATEENTVTTTSTTEAVTEASTVPETESPTEEPTEAITEPTVDETEAPTEYATESKDKECIHDYKSETVKPTCTSAGYTKKTCTKCGDVVKTDETQATGHDYTSKVTKTATCTENGIKTYTCKNCGHSYTESIKAGHDYECTDTRPATCSNTGDKTYTCKTCGNSYKETLPKNEHVWSDWVVTKEPTTTTYGKKWRTCELCNGGQEANIDPLPADETEPPATEGDDDGYSSDDDIIDGWSCVMSGHKYGDWVVTKEPTETEYGEEARTCSACGNVITRRVDKLSDVITDCNEEGLCHTASAADHARITCGDNYYKIVCICGRANHGETRDAALAKFNAHTAEKLYSYCGEIMRESLNHYHNNTDITVVCTVCGKTVDYMDCSRKCWGYGDRAECAYD